MCWRYMELGGPIMWPLLACSILLGAVLFERFWTVLIRHRLARRAVAEASLHFHRRVLGLFIELPPSIGLLGTVVGVVQSFQLVQGQLNGKAVGAGLGVACLTTIFGLSIAIVAMLSRHLLDWAAGSPPAPRETT